MMAKLRQHQGASLQEQYKIAFDLSNRPIAFGAWDLALFAMAAIGLLLVILPQSIFDRIVTRGLKGVWGKLFAWVFFLVTAGSSIASVYGYKHQEAALQTDDRAGRATVVEGCLQYFHPMPMQGHDDERIEVNGHLFNYSDYDDTPAFHNTVSHGGPIHPDSKVRLTTVGNNIVRVEVKQKACTPAPEFPNGTASS